MTDAEREKREAEEFAALIGGLLAAFLLTGRGRFERRRGVWMLDGKAVSPVTIRTILKRLKRVGGGFLSGLTRQVFEGKITPREWREKMGSNVRSAHLVAGALAAGSIERVQRRKEFRERIDREERFLDNFEGQIKRNAAGSVEKAQSRAKSYLMAAAVTYGVIDQIERTENGATEAIRIQTSAESCAGCEEYANEWMPIDDMPEIGSLDCGSRCLCYLEYR